VRREGGEEEGREGREGEEVRRGREEREWHEVEGTQYPHNPISASLQPRIP